MSDQQNEIAYDLSADRVFRGMRIAGSNDCDRHFLTGVFIEPIEDGGAWIVATDGKIMLVQRDREATAEDKAIIRFSAPQFAPFFGDDEDADDEDTFVTQGWHWGDDRVTVPKLALSQTVAAPVAAKGHNPWLHVLAERIDGKFPDWRKPIGRAAPSPNLRRKDDLKGINVSLLDRLCGPRHGFHGVQIHGSFSDEKPLLVTFGEDPDSFGVINKCYLSMTSSPLPDLMNAIGRDDLAGNSCRLVAIDEGPRPDVGNGLAEAGAFDNERPAFAGFMVRKGDFDQ